MFLFSCFQLSFLVPFDCIVIVSGADIRCPTRIRALTLNPGVKKFSQCLFYTHKKKRDERRKNTTTKNFGGSHHPCQLVSRLYARATRFVDRRANRVSSSASTETKRLPCARHPSQIVGGSLCVLRFSQRRRTNDAVPFDSYKICDVYH